MHEEKEKAETARNEKGLGGLHLLVLPEKIFLIGFTPRVLAPAARRRFCEW